VLILHSYNAASGWCNRVTAGIRRVLGGVWTGAEVSIEFMDTRRASSEEYFRELEALYRTKYAGWKVDVLICSDDQALSFALGPGQELFPGAPVVFCSATDFDPSMRVGRQLTGVLEELGIRETLEVALRLHPQTREVVVVTDTTRTGRSIRTLAQEDFRPYADRLSFRYLADLSVEELEKEVSELSEGAVVLLCLFSRDSFGREFSCESGVRRLAERCRVPIYGLWESYLGHGIVGPTIPCPR